MEKRKAAKDDFENRKWVVNIRIKTTILTVDGHDVIYVWKATDGGRVQHTTSINGSHPMFQQLMEFLKALDPHITELRNAAGAYETATKDRSAICEMGDILLGTGKQCYSADAVLRRVKEMAGAAT